MSNMYLRAVSPDSQSDAEVLIKMRRACGWQENEVPDWLEEIKNNQRLIWFICMDDHMRMAALILEDVKDASVASLTTTGRVGIASLFVYQEFRRQGGGLWAFKELEKVASQLGATTVTVITATKGRLVSWYESLGYRMYRIDPERFKGGASEELLKHSHYPILSEIFQSMSQDLFNPADTLFHFPWPTGLTGIERVACSSMGDLQRMLSAYFNLPITVQRLWVSPMAFPRPTASPTNPLIQHRRVHLLTSPMSIGPTTSTGIQDAVRRVVCTATSIVRITSEPAAKRFLDEKYAIGQVFRILGRVADFQLLEVTISPSLATGGGAVKQILRRKYILKTEGFECEIEEVFPDRAMFTSSPEQWSATTDDSTDKFT